MVNRDQFVCDAQPKDWPWADMPAGVYFPREVANFTEDNLWLADVPSRFVEPVGPCIKF